MHENTYLPGSSSRQTEAVVIGYSSPGSGEVEFSIDTQLVEGGIEITSIVALIYLIKAITVLLRVTKVSQ